MANAMITEGSELPKASSGKVQRFQLRQRAKAAAA
jgi:acyl-coenzyme A synthetase/AMP-(fatty) acid ligase